MFAPLPPLCKGRGTACGGGIVFRPTLDLTKRCFLSFTIPQSAPLTAPFTQGSQTGETTSGREPFPVLQARRWPVTWRAGSRFCFVYALLFACGGFDPPCSRVPSPNKKPVHSYRTGFCIWFALSPLTLFLSLFKKSFRFLFFRKGRSNFFLSTPRGSRGR